MSEIEERIVQFGCGLSSGPSWINYDASPTLKLQRLPVIGKSIAMVVKPRFPADVRVGDAVSGLPERDATVDIVYCSHVLEHLALEDFRSALSEVMRILKPGGTFRGVIPDLEILIGQYTAHPSPTACSDFIRGTGLGLQARSASIVGRLRAAFGNSGHRWMWDYAGLESELATAGFTDVRRAMLGDNPNATLREVESESRWTNALGFECTRP
jgi:SAM-dependent methyltransferase